MTLSCFMAWRRIKFACRDISSTHTLCDIETLNKQAQDEAFYDVSAISFHAYPYVQENYALMGCGGSVGEGYGPMIISMKPMSQDDLKRVKVAIPGTMTTAFLALKIFNPGDRD